MRYKTYNIPGKIFTHRGDKSSVYLGSNPILNSSDVLDEIFAPLWIKKPLALKTVVCSHGKQSTILIYI